LVQPTQNEGYGLVLVKSSLRQRGLRRLCGAVLLLVALSAWPAYARVHHSEAWARDRFVTAERMREALNGRPPADRTRRDYQRVLNNYRSVYLGAPASIKADPSVVAVAETLVEMGRRFDDDKILNEAIGQYKFLRREYPGSKYRFDGLFTIGEIYKDDLDQPEAARTTFQEFLRRYPHNRLADDARRAITELDQDAAAEKAASAKKPAQKGKAGRSDAGKSDKVAKDRVGLDSGLRPGSAKNDPSKGELSKGVAAKEESGKEESAKDAFSGQPAEHLPRVTGIRHWSTPDYTRVAIDVEGDIKFQSQRIADPDRIFFDLPDTKLASTLVGKSFDVDDGFLKKIRVAQFAHGRTRVVLEVDNLSDYDAFLLPNPYRLIIDIHGGDIHGKTPQRKPAKDAEAPAETANDKPAPRTGPGIDADPSSPESKPIAPAQVGKAPVTSMDVSDSKLSVSAKTTPGKKQAAPVKKIVEADDDDDIPVRAAKMQPPPMRSKTSVAANKNAAKKASEDEADANGVDSNPPASELADNAQAGRKSASRTLASRKPGPADNLDVHEAKPTARGDRSLIRALGLKIGKIVIDAGHGGHDTGTIGPNGLEEKDLVLEVSRRLGRLLETRLGAEVVYTRKDDTFIPLETRTAIANQARADLFISIHANSSHDASARGVETYYLNFTSSPEALEVAARENAVSEKSIYELQDLVKKIALKEKIEESREFASDVQESLHSGLAVKSAGVRDRGVKKAPFIVLIGANMPSILAEISFVSNPADERRLETGEYRQRIAESLYRGMAKYVNGLSGVKVASKMDKPAGQ
jgi:N-acetylmuramoyl-L-alanine amidase